MFFPAVGSFGGKLQKGNYSGIGLRCKNKEKRGCSQIICILRRKEAREKVSQLTFFVFK